MPKYRTAKIVCAALLAIAAAAATTVVQAADALRVDSESLAAAHATIHKALDAQTKLEFIETPLCCVVDYLRDLHKIRIEFDRKAFDDVERGPGAPITKTLEGVSLRSALALLLNDLNLTYVVENEVLLITTPERAAARPEIRIYDVADFLPQQPAERKPVARRAAHASGTTNAAKVEEPPESQAIDAADAEPRRGGYPASFSSRTEAVHDDLIEAIVATIAPATWDCVGGPGSIGAFRSQGLDVLIVSQTRAVHEQIEALLATLRKMREPQRLPSGVRPKMK